MTRRCKCGGRLEPAVVKSRAGSAVQWVCDNQWADVEHGEEGETLRDAVRTEYADRVWWSTIATWDRAALENYLRCAAHNIAEIERRAEIVRQCMSSLDA